MLEDEKKPSGLTNRYCLQTLLKKPGLRRDEASAYLVLMHGVERAPKTLAKYLSQGLGPKYEHIGRTPLYLRDDLDEWVATNLKRGRAA